MPISDSTAPNGSSGVDESSLLRGANRTTATITISDTTTLTTNTDPHQNDGEIHQPVSRKPATSGPRLPPAPAKPAQIAIAFARSRGGKTAVSNDNVAGITNAAPMPEIERDAITASDESAKAPSSEPAANMASLADQCLFATESVADRTRRQQQTGEDDRVRVDDPLQIGRRRAE